MTLCVGGWPCRHLLIKCHWLQRLSGLCEAGFYVLRLCCLGLVKCSAVKRNLISLSLKASVRQEMRNGAISGTIHHGTWMYSSIKDSLLLLPLDSFLSNKGRETGPLSHGVSDCLHTCAGDWLEEGHFNIHFIYGDLDILYIINRINLSCCCC